MSQGDMSKLRQLYHCYDGSKLLHDKIKTQGLCVALFIYRTRAIITRGLYTYYPLFEVNLCTVTFGLMYG
jgi:hypothetical protein